MNKVYASVVAAYGLIATAPALATTYHVAPGRMGSHLATIQAAIDAASSGDEIVLADGMFTGRGNWDVKFGTKELVLRSEHGYEATTIDCGCFDVPNWSQHRGIIIEGGQTAATRIEGITVQSSDSGGDGGAFRIVGASPVIRNVRIQRNPAFERGAGMFVQDGSPTIEDCVFLGYYGGWVWGSAICGERSSLSVQRCSFNSFHGIAVLIDGGTFADCIFSDNLGPYDGQGIALSASGPVAVLRSTFSRTFGSSLTAGSGSLVDGCRFEDNMGDFGAAVRGGDMTIRNSVFLRNEAGFTGSAIEVEGVAALDHCVFAHNTKDVISVGGSGALTVSQCTFVGNGSHSSIPDGPGSSIASSWGSPSIAIDHSIIAEGGAGSPALNCTVPPASLVVTCSDIFGNEGGDWTGCVAGMDGANGNLSADPLFCSVGGGDLSLRANSPCAPPSSGECALIGALGVGCGATALQERSWGAIKAIYR